MSVDKRAKRGLIAPIRLTVTLAARELGVSSRGLKRKLLSNAILPGEDGMFSMRQIFNAMNGSDNSLERKAKEARWQARIDEAEFVRIRLEEKREKLVNLDAVEIWLDDFLTIFFQGIRHSSMSEAEKKQLRDQMLEAADRKLPASGSLESETAIRQHLARQKAREYEERVMSKVKEERRQREELERKRKAESEQRREQWLREQESGAATSKNDQVQ